MHKKAGKHKAINFFKTNYTMISSLESPDEYGCTNKCLELLNTCNDTIYKPITLVDNTGCQECDMTYNYLYRCSNCKAKIYLGNYCSNCGCKLKI